MRRSVIVALILAGVILPTQPAIAGFYSGNELQEKCGATAGSRDYYQNTALCFGFVAGVSGTLSMMSGAGKGYPYCPPQQITLGQATDIVRKYLNEHPEERHLDGITLATVALLNAFKCPRGN